MKVVCNRCSTEYEFDDALVSRRGTTVKCTNCGHQFKVRPDTAQGQETEDRWVLRKPDGRLLTFTTMRELQKAIETGILDGADQFSRDGRTFRPLGAVAELETFLKRQVHKASYPTPKGGVGLASKPPTQDPVPLSGSTPPPPGGSEKRTSPSTAPTRKVSDLDAINDRVTPNMMAPAAHQTDRSLTRRRGRRRVGGPERTDGALPETDDAVSTQRHQDLSTGDLHRGQSATDTPVRFAEARTTSSVRDKDELEAVAEAMDRQSRHMGSVSTSQMSPLSMPPPSPRPSGLRWILGLVVVGTLGLLAGTVGKDYLQRFVSAEGAVKESDQRLEAMLRLGDELYRSGDLEGAKAEFDKASVLEPKNPRVLTGLARLEATRADQHWFERLLADDAKSKAEAQVALERRLAKLKLAVDALSATGSADVEARSVIIDSLRLHGDIKAARQRVAELGNQSAQPRTAYVLAALDLAEEAPDWEGVESRLRVALEAEKGLGRARAALVYTLSRTGKKEAALLELERLRKGNFPSQLADALGRFVETTVAPETEPDTEATEKGKGAKKLGAKGDTRSAMERAAEARKARQWDVAASFYQQALQQNPSDVEAICGLAAASNARGNRAAAESHYDAALRIKPSHKPALLGSAGVKWASGRKSEAVRLYKSLLASGATSALATERIQSFEGGGSQGAEAPSEQGATPEESAKPGAETPDKSEAEETPPASPEKAPAEGEAPSGPPPTDQEEPKAPKLEEALPLE